MSHKTNKAFARCNRNTEFGLACILNEEQHLLLKCIWILVIDNNIFHLLSVYDPNFITMSNPYVSLPIPQPLFDRIDKFPVSSE